MLTQGQKDGYKVIFINVKHIFNSEYAKNIRTYLDNISIVKSNTGEELFEVFRACYWE